MKNKDKTDVRTVTFSIKNIKTDNIVLYKPINRNTERWSDASKRWSYDSPEDNEDGTMTMTEEQVYCSSKRALEELEQAVQELEQAEQELNRAKNRMESLRHVSALLASQGSNQGLTIAV